MRAPPAKSSVPAPESTRVESPTEGSTGLPKAVRPALEILRRLGLRPGAAAARIKSGLEALRAAGKLAPTDDQIVQAALGAVTG